MLGWIQAAMQQNTIIGLHPSKPKKTKEKTGSKFAKILSEF